MRFKVVLSKNDKKINKDHRRVILSLIKRVLELNNLKDKYFGKYKKKNYTFSVYMNVDNISDDVINLKTSTMGLEFSFLDEEMYNDYYNSFKKMFCKTIRNIDILDTYDTSDNKLKYYNDNEIINVTCDVKSSIMVRSKSSIGKDWYYTNDDSEYNKILNRNLKTILNIDSEDDLIKVEFSKSRKVVVSFYEYKIPTDIGTLNITGSKKIIEYLYKTGLGSRTSCGFGMLDISGVDRVENN